ncbi:DUF1289 domain-containing protein [Shewanella denitrificans]|uniref:DUF1289 domain-containing protein n=2 Tax=Shewanella denitrificans TaxID=192073 RepID=UPI0009FEDD96|nr:DUF1289 domain-containing protein [Shewanella denitrificans]
MNMLSGQSELSPCVRHCCLDANDVCLGCQRTLVEILAWHSMADSQKQQLMAELPLRQLGGKPSASSIMNQNKKA